MKPVFEKEKEKRNEKGNNPNQLGTATAEKCMWGCTLKSSHTEVVYATEATCTIG
jgi:hypothetical protein